LRRHGGDPVNGTSHLDVIKLFMADPETTGNNHDREIGGAAKKKAAEWDRENGHQAGRRDKLAG